MLGFKKKPDDEPDSHDTPVKKTPERKKTPGLKKRACIILFVLVAVGGASFPLYKQYVVPKDSTGPNAVYQKIELNHFNIPDEMIRFSFDYFPDLYDAMIAINTEMDLFDQKIAQINVIAQKYPEQKKIADKEKKTWENAKKTLQKAFTKLEKPVKETYVLYCVNKEKGLAQIKAKNKELTELARNALIPARELTRSIKSDETVPQGFIKANIYKLKKKFL